MTLPDYLPARLRDLLHAEGVDPEHPPAVEAEAAALAPPDLELPDHTDRRFVTIDSPGARGLDQALHVERRGDGFLVCYAVADAAAFVRPGTAVFDEALRRGATVYAPGFAAPMLPQAVQGQASLTPSVDRRAVVFAFTLDGDGSCASITVERARIRSRARFTFADVETFYEGGRPPMRDPQVVRSLEALAAVGALLVDRRGSSARPARAAVRLRAGELVFVASAEQSLADRYHEELSVLCNTAAARLLQGPGRLPVYRRGDGRFTAEPGPEPYVRVTSPLREVVGLYLHHELMAPLGDEALRDRVIEAAQAAEGRQRRIDDAVHRLALDALLQGDLYATRARRGTVVEVADDGVVVRLDRPAVALTVDRRSLSLRHRDPAVGDRVVVQPFARIDDRWDIRVTVT